MRNILIILSFTLLILSCQTLPHANSPELQGKEALVTGYNWGYPDAEHELEELVLVSAGQWLRVDFSWKELESEQGDWDFREMDYFMEWCHQNDIKVLGLLAYDTPWIHSDGRRKRAIPPEQMVHYLSYVETVVYRYGDMVDEWEIWNEPNMFNNRFWGRSDEDFFNLTRETIDRIHLIAPDAFVLAGALWRFDRPYLRRFLRSGALDRADALSFHPYYRNPRRTYIASRGLIDYARSLGFSGEFRITEVGYPTQGSYVTRVAEEEFPRYFVETQFYLGQLGIPYIIWYRLDQHEPLDPTDSEDHFGLYHVYDDGSWRGKTGSFASRIYGERLNNAIISPGIINLQSLPPHILRGVYSSSGSSLYHLMISTQEQESDLAISGLSSGVIENLSNGEMIRVDGSREFTILRDEPLLITISADDSDSFSLELQ